MIRRIIVALVMVDLAAFAATARSQATLFMFEGDRVGDQLGNAVSALGDIDGDSVGDLIVGAWQNGLPGDGGYARVYSGRDGHVLFTFHGDNFDPWGDGDALGWSVAGAGDVNGDGVPDMIVGSPYDDLVSFDSGSARVFSGKNGSLLYTFTGTPGDISGFGWGVAGPGDPTVTGSRILWWARRVTTPSSHRPVRCGSSRGPTERSWMGSQAAMPATLWAGPPPRRET
ncbi:MAG: integrin alpha [Planctomycetota bacterium]